MKRIIKKLEREGSITVTRRQILMHVKASDDSHYLSDNDCLVDVSNSYSETVYPDHITSQLLDKTTGNVQILN